MRRLRVVLASAALLLGGCARGEDFASRRSEVTVDSSAVVPPQALASARVVADELTKELAGVLFSTLDSKGAAEAIRVCSEGAQQMTAAHAREGIGVRRIGTRLRNPSNRPDEFESREMETLQAQNAAGTLPEEVARVTVGPGGARVLRYLRPIVLQERCLTCHGPLEELDPDVASILGERYPEDGATGYAVGDIRGVVSVTVALESEP